MGQWRKEFSRTTIKATWTITGGRVETRERGGFEGSGEKIQPTVS